MSSINKDNRDSQEIDLFQVSKSIGNFFNRVSMTVFRGILFLKRNVIIIGVLLLIGVVAGFYLDQKSKAYDHEIIVIPNFESVDYLYAKVNLINAKISENDTVFLKKNVRIQHPEKLIAIKIEPITDIYKFVEENPQNLELLKLMVESGELKKVLDEEVTSKNYMYHKIFLKTKGKTHNKRTIVPLLDYLNESDYFSTYQEQTIKNVDAKIKANDSTIAQIDRFLGSLSSKERNAEKKDKLVYFSENSQLNDVINTKGRLVEEQAKWKIRKINYAKIVKEVDTTMNVRDLTSSNGKLKFILPFILVLIFILLGLFRKFYTSQMLKLQNASDK